MPAAQTADMLIRVRVETRDVDRKIAALERQMQGFQNRVSKAGSFGGRGILGGIDEASNKLRSFGKDIQWTGRQLEFRFTLPLVLAGAAATKFALDNEAAFTKLKKVYGTGGSLTDQQVHELDKLREAFRLLSDQFGVNQAEVISIGAAWAAAGAEGVALGKATKLTLQAMIIGDMAADEAAKSLIALRAQYDLTTSSLVGPNSLQQALATFNVIENETAANFDDLIQAVTRGGAAARTAGVDFRHFAALTASLAEGGTTAASAGNALKTIFSRLADPASDAKDILGAMNVNFQEFMKLPGVERIEMLAHKFDDLSDAQQSVVSSTIAGRFQISRFDLLMRDILDPLGAYQTALRATADEQKNLDAYNREIITYLQSSPQRFKILTTQIQNLLAEAILPLLPAIIGVLEQITKLIRGFTDLSPQTQETILIFLAMLAALGPLTSYLGSFSILLGVLGDSFLFPIKQMDRFLKLLLGVPKAANLGAGFSAAFQKIVIAVEYMMSGVYYTITKGFQAAARGAALLWDAMMPVFAAIGRALAAAVSAGYSVVVALFGAIGTAAGTAFEAAVLLFSNPLTWAVIGAAMAIALIVVFRKEIWRGLVSIKRLIDHWGNTNFLKPAQEFFNQLGQQIGDAIGMIAKVLDTIGRGVVDAIKFIGRAFAALPRIVFEALKAVVEVIYRLGKAIRDGLMDALNPFQRHSPSLVDLVVEGVDVIAEKYKQLPGIIGPALSKSAQDMRAFKNATADAFDNLARQEIGQKKISIVQAAPGAGPSVDAMIGDLNGLQSELRQVTREFGAQQIVVDRWEKELKDSTTTLKDAQNLLDDLQNAASKLSDQLSDAKDTLSTWLDTPIAGMRDMEDAIFSNEMAQKRLRLEMMQMEDAGQVIDDIESKMAALAGDIEKLVGEREDLRLSGAGSDVLGPIDDQITALAAQQNQLAESADGIYALQDQLAQLQREGERLDLEQSLGFDPLTRQIEQAGQAMTELPFDTILAGVQSSKASVDALKVSYEAAQDQLRAQQVVVDDLDVKHTALQRTYDAEKDKLDELGDIYDALAGQISDINSALDSFAEKVSSGSSNAMENFGAAAGGDFAEAFDAAMPDEEDIDEWVKGLKEQMGSFNLGDMLAKPFKTGWHKVEDWWNNTAFPWIKRTFGTGGTLNRWLENVYGAVGDALKAPFKKFWEWMKGFGQKIIDVIMWPFNWVADALVWKSVIPDMIDEIIRLFLTVPIRIAEAIVGVPAAMLKWGVDIMQGAWNGITSIWDNVIYPFFSNIMSTFTGFFGTALTWLYNKGRDILQGMWNGVTEVWTRFKSWIGGMGTFLAGLLGNAIDWLFGIGKDILQGLWNGVTEVWTRFKSWIGGMGSFLPGLIPEPLKVLLEVGKKIMQGFFDGIHSVWDAGKGFFGSVGGFISDHKGPPSKDRVLLVNNGMLIMEGLMRGLQIGWAGVRNFLNSATADFAGNLDPLFVTAAIGRGGAGGSSVVGGESSSRSVNFYGDLSFPNITSPNDAKKFLDNLESLVD